MADMQNMQGLRTFLDSLAEASAAAILPYFRADAAIDNKARGGFDPVTAADRDGEAAMRRLIEATWPGHGIIGEEFGNTNEDAEYVWVLDPIDGTRAFIAGLPTWGTLIGLMRNGRPILGMMAQPFTGERYAGDCDSAWYGGPDGDKPLEARSCAALAEATLMTTTPFLFSAEEKPRYDRVEAACRNIRYGTDCYGYAMVAAGHADIVVEAGLNPYDIVALIPIIEGAGGRVTGWAGGTAARGGRVLACGDAKVHAEALALLRE